MKEIVILAVSAVVSGALASLGVGGGAILIVMLSTFLSFSQKLSAQLNLIFFLPIALVSTIIYHKKGLIDLKSVWRMALTGVVGAILGVAVAPYITADWLSRLFGVFLIFASFQILLKKEK